MNTVRKIDIDDKVIAVRFGRGDHEETERELQSRAAELNYQLCAAATVPHTHKGRTK